MADRSLVPARVQTLEAVRSASGSGWDPEMFHVINQRDNALIEDEILNGAGSNKFVYNFDIQGKPVTGISVVGARQLASHYGGLKHRIVASVQKIGALFTFTSYPHDGMEMRVSCARVAELADEDDFYSAIAETTDIKTGNSVQIEVRESRQEKRRDGTLYERPNYTKIAQAKARRNGILDLVPQDLQIQWKEQMLKLGKSENITASVIDEKRSGVLRFAASKAIPVSREALHELGMDQLTGLAEAARGGNAAAFAQAAQALGLVHAQIEQGAEEAITLAPGTKAPAAVAAKRGGAQQARTQQAAQDGPQQQDGDPGHGEPTPAPSPTPAPTTPAPTTAAPPTDAPQQETRAAAPQAQGGSRRGLFGSE